MLREELFHWRRWSGLSQSDVAAMDTTTTRTVNDVKAWELGTTTVPAIFDRLIILPPQVRTEAQAMVATLGAFFTSTATGATTTRDREWASAMATRSVPFLWLSGDRV